MEYTLYQFPWSLFSLMARYTIALRGEPISPAGEMKIVEKVVNLQRDENLAEKYLLEINAKGQVPALTYPGLPNPLTSTLAITHLLAASYPSLIPLTHANTISTLLTALHDIQPLSLSTAPPEDRTADVHNPSLNALLARSDISDTYREALRSKADFHNRTLLHALDDDAIRRAETQTRDFLAGVGAVYTAHGAGSSEWLFGAEVGATALDAQTVAFVARLLDAGREDLVPEGVRVWAEGLMRGKGWQEVTGGRGTLFEVWVGRMRGRWEEVGGGEAWASWLMREAKSGGLVL